MTDYAARAQAAATIAAQRRDLRSGNVGPIGWLVAELDAARTELRAQRTAIADACGRIDEALGGLHSAGAGTEARIAGARIASAVTDLRAVVDDPSSKERSE